MLAYGGKTMLDPLAEDHHHELLAITRRSFDWATAAAMPSRRPRGSMRTLRRDGTYFRLAEPDWIDPLDASTLSARAADGPARRVRCHLPQRQRAHQSATAADNLAGLPYGPEDLDPSEQDDLVTVEVPTRAHFDWISEGVLAAVALPASYPRHCNGGPVTDATCQPIGRRAFDASSPEPPAARRRRTLRPTIRSLPSSTALWDRARVAIRVPFAAWW